MRIGYLSTAYHTSHILKKILKAEWKFFSTGMEVIRAFKEKKIDLGYVGLAPVIHSKNKGLDIVCIAGGHVEGTFIAGRTEKDFPECLKGKKVGTLAKGTIHDVILNSVKYRFDIDFEVVNYNFSEFVLDEFIDGNLDFVCGTPNLVVLAEKHSAKIVCGSEELWKWNPSYGIVVDKEFCNEKPEEVFDFLIRHEWACNLLRESIDYASYKIYESYRGDLDINTIQRIIELSPKYCASIPEEYIESTLKLAKFMKTMGYVEEIPKKDEIFDLSFISEVHPQKDHYSQMKDKCYLAKNL